MTLHSELPSKNTIENAFGSIAKRITKRNNQFVVTVDFANYMKAQSIADTFGNFDSIAKQSIVKIK